MKSSHVWGLRFLFLPPSPWPLVLFVFPLTAANHSFVLPAPHLNLPLLQSPLSLLPHAQSQVLQHPPVLEEAKENLVTLHTESSPFPTYTFRPF